MNRNDSLAPRLILDELFDLELYRELHVFSSGGLKETLAQLIPVEERHYAFWREFFGVEAAELDWPRRLRLRALSALCRAFGPPAVHLVLETIEVHGVRKYLAVWEEYKARPIGRAVKEILDDELEHENALVGAVSARTISPERIRNVILGFNDGLVEIMGALSGFFAAFHESRLVLMASSSVAAAGALSMAAGAFAASSSEREMQETERRRAEFLAGPSASGEAPADPRHAAAVVGASYFLGAMVPVLPVLLGAGTVLVSALTAGTLIVLVSASLAFLSGMDVRRRILLNLVIMAGAIGVTYGIGTLAKNAWGVGIVP